MRRLGVLAAIASVLGVIALCEPCKLQREQAAAPADPGRLAGPPRPSLAARGSAAAARRAPGRIAPLPRSLADTEVDGALSAGADGRLVVSRQTRQLFDYFLSAEGEEPDAVIRDRVAHEAARLPAAAAAAALELFDHYVDYRRRGAALLATRPADPVSALVALQRDCFGADDAEVLFGEDNLALAAALARY